MDWSKAKNILIVAFIITNLFLIYLIGSQMFNEDIHLISDEYMDSVISFLADNGIKVKGQIPTEVISLPILEVKYESFSNSSIIEGLLGETYHTVSENHYKRDTREVVIEGNKKLRYINHSKDNLDYSIDEKKAIELSRKFLQQHGLYREDIVLYQIFFDVIEEFDSFPTYKFVYHQKYRNRFLGESYIHVFINHRGVVGLEVMLLSHVKTKSRVRTIPATEALLRTVSTILKQNKGRVSITDIELGYYFNPYDQKLPNIHSIQSATAFPAWRITLENGKTYYVEAIRN